MKNKLIVFFTLLTFAAQAGGPWPQPKGKGFFKLSEWWIVYDQHYTDAGKLDPNVTTGIFTTAFYGEYGFTDRFTGIVYAPLLTRNYMNNLRSATTNEILVPGEALNALGDIDLGFKYGLTAAGSSLPVSITLFLGLPTGTPVAGELNNLQTGDGEFNQLLQLDAGKGFSIGKTPAYASAYVGFNHRTEGFSEEFRYGLEFGAGLWNEKLWLTTRLTAVESFKNGDTAGSINSTSIFANNTEFLSIGIEAAYYLTNRWGVSASVAGAVRGEIIAAAPMYSAGIFYDLK